MQFHDMDEVDLKLSLLSGESIKLENLDISPYNLRDIKNYGYTNYLNNLQWISLSVDEFIDTVDDEDRKNFLIEKKDSLKSFDFYFNFGGQEMRERFMSCLSMVFKTNDLTIIGEGIIGLHLEEMGIVRFDSDGDIHIDEYKLSLLTEDDIKIINRDNFDDIIKIVKLQNYLENPNELISKNNANPIDDRTRKFIEHMEKMRKKVEEKKMQQRSDDGDTIDISDIVSAVSSKSNSINIINIWELSLYQIYDEYARLEVIDNYDLSIKAMMAGSEDTELRHWSSKI